jgi:hypothetical protein
MMRLAMLAPLQVEKMVLQKLEPLVLVVRAQLALQTLKWRQQFWLRQLLRCGSR